MQPAITPRLPIPGICCSDPYAPLTAACPSAGIGMVERDGELRRDAAAAASISSSGAVDFCHMLFHRSAGYPNDQRHQGEMDPRRGEQRPVCGITTHLVSLEARPSRAKTEMEPRMLAECTINDAPTLPYAKSATDHTHSVSR